MPTVSKSSTLTLSALTAQAAKPLFSVSLPSASKRPSSPAHPSCAYQKKNKRRKKGNKGRFERKERDRGEGDGSKEDGEWKPERWEGRRRGRPYAEVGDMYEGTEEVDLTEEVETLQGFVNEEGRRNAPFEIADDIDEDMGVFDDDDVVMDVFERPPDMTSALRGAILSGYEAFNGGQGPLLAGVGGPVPVVRQSHVVATNEPPHFPHGQLPILEQSRPVPTYKPPDFSLREQPSQCESWQSRLPVPTYRPPQFPIRKRPTQQNVKTQPRVKIHRTLILTFKLSSQAQFAVSSYIELSKMNQLRITEKVDANDDRENQSGGAGSFPAQHTPRITTIKILAGWRDQHWMAKMKNNVGTEANFSDQGQEAEGQEIEEPHEAEQVQYEAKDDALVEESAPEAGALVAKNLDEAGDLLAFAEDPIPGDQEGDIDRGQGQYVDELPVPTADAPNADTLSPPQPEPVQPMQDHSPDTDAYFPQYEVPPLPPPQEDGQVSWDQNPMERPGVEYYTQVDDEAEQQWPRSYDEFGNLPDFSAPGIHQEEEDTMVVAAQAGNPYALAVIQGRFAEAAEQLGLNTVAGQEEHQLQHPAEEVVWENHVPAEVQQPLTTGGGGFANHGPTEAEVLQPPIQSTQVRDTRPRSDSELVAEYLREFEAQKEVERRLGIDSLFA